jgi:hypothetical protein
LATIFAAKSRAAADADQTCRREGRKAEGRRCGEMIRLAGVDLRAPAYLMPTYLMQVYLMQTYLVQTWVIQARAPQT